MTQQELERLTPEEKRVAIAVTCGWKMLPRDKWLHKGNASNRHPSGRPGPTMTDTEIPNYLLDLNAMRRAVMTQPGQVRKAMRFYLYNICGQQEAHDATAEQRADAFLLSV